MIKREEIESWVKEAMAATDKEYQLVEVVRTAVELTASKCADVVQEFKSGSALHSPLDHVLDAVAERIHKEIGYKLVDGPMPKRSR